VATDCAGGGARYLVQDGHNGLLIPVRDEDALVDALRRILTDGALAQTLGANALKVRQTLAPDVIHQRWVETVTAALAACKDRR
jgi:glycosyltransferase involved in cell wall biosynthesis